jgi:hypothetical protein
LDASCFLGYIDEMTQIQPILLSAIACDKVIFDKVSGMPSIIDIVQTINAKTYPARHPQIVFFCELTNGHGTTKARIRLVDTQEEEKIIFEQEGTLQFKDVKQIVTLAMNLQGIVFPRPGEYRFQLFAGEQLLGERRITCRKVKLPPKTGTNESTEG